MKAHAWDGQFRSIEELTFIVEAVDSVNAGAFVVAHQEEEVLRILDLVGQQGADHLQRLLPPVNGVASE